MRKKIIISIIIVSFIPLFVSSYLIDWFLESDYAQSRVRSGIDKLYEQVGSEKDEIIKALTEDFKDNKEMNVDRIKKLDNNEKDNLTTLIIQRNNEYIYISDSIKEIVEKSKDFNTSGTIENASDTNYDVYESIYFKDANGLVHVSLVVNYDYFEVYMDHYNSYYLNLFIAMFTVLLIIMILWISNHIKKSLNMIESITKEIECGNLDSKLTYTRKDEFKKIADVIESLKISLKGSIKEREKLENDKKKMLVNITHDIKTPITSIKGYIQAINDGIVKDEDTLSEYLQIISEKSDVIDLMVKDFNEIVKYDYGNMLLSAEYIDLDHFIRDCVEEYSYTNKDIEIKYDLKKENLMVLFDPKLMQRVLSNIISNTIKYNKGRKINIIIEIEENSNNYIIKISDNGVGVLDRNAENIFTRFYREDESRNSDIEGSGIGLSICRDIINLHSGKIIAYNSQNRFVVQIDLPKQRLFVEI
ncbi:MAG: HAMP domain-containing sensor histidine kinase [Acidaminobacteraceae bacterium]